MEELEDADAPVTALPTEVLQLVFSLLPTEDLCAVVDVCRQWRDACRCAAVWRHRHVSASPVHQLLKVLENAPELKGITISSGRMRYWEDGRTDTEWHCSVVRSLTVWCNPPDDISLAVLRRYSPTAETLWVYDVSLAILHALAESRCLRELRLLGHIDDDVSVGELRHVLQRCAAPLQQLNLKTARVRPRCLRGPKGHEVTTSELVEVFVEEKGDTLRSLILPGRHSVVMDCVLDKVAERCPGLESLGADFCDGARLIKALPHLRRLRLWWSLRTPSARDVEDLRELRTADGAPLARLEHLTLDMGGQDANLEYAVALVRLCPRLQVLRVAEEAEGRLERLTAAAAAAGNAALELKVFPARSKYVHITVPW